MSLLTDLEDLLHKVEMSQICLADMICDCKTEAGADTREKYEAKYRFMRGLETDLRAWRNKVGSGDMTLDEGRLPFSDLGLCPKCGADALMCAACDYPTEGTGRSETPFTDEPQYTEGAELTRLGMGQVFRSSGIGNWTSDYTDHIDKGGSDE